MKKYMNYFCILFLFLMIVSLSGCKYEQRIEKVNVQSKELKEELNKSKKKIEELEEKLKANPVDEVNIYEEIYKDYRQYIDSNTELSENADNKKPSINNIYIGSNYKDVSKLFGNEYIETIEYNAAGYSSNNSFLFWGFNDGTQIRFNPLLVSVIRIGNPKYKTNFGVQIGDSALEAIEYCDANYEQCVYNGVPNVGWYYIDDGVRLILLFNTDDNIHQNDLSLTNQTKVEKIELTAAVFD